VGADGPLEKLDVRGNIKLGAGDLFAPGSPDNLRIVAGSVTSNGTLERGTGFTPTHLGQGAYRIDVFPPFKAAPVVVATVTASANDDLASLANVTAGSFEIHVYDTSLKTLENNPFSFVAFGLR